jgi:anti-sigma factor RsiW
MKRCARASLIWCEEITTTVTCPLQTGDSASLLLDYGTGRLSPESTAALERHMAHCETCRAWGEQQKLLWSALDAWDTAPAASNWHAEFESRIASEPRRPLFSMTWKPAAAIAAGALLLAVSVGAPFSWSEAASHRVDLTQVEQTERALEDLDMLRQFGPA